MSPAHKIIVLKTLVMASVLAYTCNSRNQEDYGTRPAPGKKSGLLKNNLKAKSSGDVAQVVQCLLGKPWVQREKKKEEKKKF
jgi:hypothetical protein